MRIETTVIPVSWLSTVNGMKNAKVTEPQSYQARLSKVVFVSSEPKTKQLANCCGGQVLDNSYWVKNINPNAVYTV